MPAAITVQLQAPTPLFFDEDWPLEARLLDVLRRAKARLPERGQGDELKPYALAPLWRVQEKGESAPGVMGPAAYQWRVCLLDDALTAPLLQGLQATETLDLNGILLTVGQASVEETSYAELARRAQAEAQARPARAWRLGLEFITPVVLYRSGLPLPLPDPVLVFRHYLSAWDTFAPRELWINFNLLDAIQYHVAPGEHRLETRHVQWGNRRTVPGFLGGVVYTAHHWQKLGAEFLGNLQMLVRFGVFCSTGEGATRGLGQTRLLKGRV